ncbi:type IV toxin-antitoxin system AbiEi family antitoxin domain-containing protein [Alkanindiges illinoisensis]|uniref:Uncharacterized protein n=1 Tax=Alkanindiges illinoisensis TaxID=197183 RepID=A0A4Y7X8M8_9GAMM|nr:type IV toxin-antitoxin system AbiEi family antitoxin domain-containing protein [Alkanindiges illinoisensis]TEU23354.1 hypothetical protein E2B99_13640 [Alkanindiges illinoisensis]
MKKSHVEIVLEAIEDLHAQEQIVTRETLAELTQLKLTVIDDRLAYLVDSGQIHRVQRGVFVPAPVHKPARIISKIVLPGGIVKLEIGDDYVLTLTPREARTLGNLMMADSLQYANIELGHHTAVMSSEFGAQLREVQRTLAKLNGDFKKSQQIENAEAATEHL